MTGVDDDAPGSSAAGWTPSTGDDVLLHVLEILRIIWLLPGVGLVFVLAAAGPLLLVVLVVLVGPFLAWTRALWSLLSTFRQSLGSGSRIRHGGAPWRYRGLALAAVVVEVGVGGVLLVPGSASRVTGVVAATALLIVLAVVARRRLVQDGGLEAAGVEQEGDLPAA